MAKKIIVAYIPVLHQGYKQFFESNPDFHSLYILDDSILDTDRAIQKDLRRLAPDLVRQSLAIWNILDDIGIGTEKCLRELNSSAITVLMPDEDISRSVAENYFPEAIVTFFPIFLRWDRQQSNAEDPVQADLVISKDEYDIQFMNVAESESSKSSDIWRHVGAVVSRNGKELARSHNQARPTLHSSWIHGDPRNNYSKGIGIDKSIFIHAEAQIIGQAAKDGTSLEGSSMYVTTFPCPPCAMLIAEAGIRQLFFKEGYAVLDGLETLRSKKIEIIRVVAKQKKEITEKELVVPYPEK